MKRSTRSLRLQITLTVTLGLLLVWAVALYELHRSRDAALREADVRTSIEAQVFAEYSRSAFKRINEFILDVRSRWTGDPKTFSTIVQQTQENISDLSFQVAILDKKGFLAFSSLTNSPDRTDLSEREHFLVHQEAENRDRLFISKPILGKVSGKWSIQVTRPIFEDGGFDGVIVVSISPDQFTGFAGKLRLEKEDALSVIRDTGEILARFPSSLGLGKILIDRPYLGNNPSDSGNYRDRAVVDGIERIYGYYRLPEYGLTFVVGESMDGVLASYKAQQKIIITGTLTISVLAISLFFFLFRSLAALEEARQQLDAIFTLSPDGFVSFDATHRVKYASPAFCCMTGLSLADLEGIDENAFSLKLNALCSSVAPFPGMDALRLAQEGEPDRRSSAISHQPRLLLQLAALGDRVLEVRFQMSDAEAVSQILYFCDVTHETEVDRLKSEFLSTAAHELRTPMASIYGFSELLLMKNYDTSTSRELLTVIHRQADLMSSIINELLDLARIEARQGKDFIFEIVNLESVVDDAVSGFSLPNNRERPVMVLPEERLEVSADHKKLQQVVSNLISNAYKYSPAGGEVALTYRVDSSGDRRWFGIEVRDHGIGMSQAQRARVFERFYRADTSGNIPGTGLGMSIVKEIIELHHGRIDIQTALGAGTTVTVWLPEAQEVTA